MLLPKASVAAIALLSSVAMAADAGPQGFCERLAPKLGLKRDAALAESTAQSHQWSKNLLGFGELLFGGHATASFSVGPADGGAGEAPPPNDCEMTRKGALCKIEGPALLRIGTKNGKVSENAALGERAEVEMQNTTLYCRNP